MLLPEWTPPTRSSEFASAHVSELTARTASWAGEMTTSSKKLWNHLQKSENRTQRVFENLDFEDQYSKPLIASPHIIVWGRINSVGWSRNLCPPVSSSVVWPQWSWVLSWRNTKFFVLRRSFQHPEMNHHWTTSGSDVGHRGRDWFQWTVSCRQIRGQHGPFKTFGKKFNRIEATVVDGHNCYRNVKSFLIHASSFTCNGLVPLGCARICSTVWCK